MIRLTIAHEPHSHLINERMRHLGLFVRVDWGRMWVRDGLGSRRKAERAVR